MKKLREIFQNNTRVIADITQDEAVEFANLLFAPIKINWDTYKNLEKDGFWVMGTDKIGTRYYCRVNKYFEIHEKTIVSTTDKDGATSQKEYSGHLGKIGLSWSEGLPYINVVDWFLQKGFNVFAEYYQ